MATTRDSSQALDYPQKTSRLPCQQTEKHEKIPIQLDGVAGTLLIPLLARAYDNALPDPILGDVYAQDVLDKIEFDVAAMSLTPFQNCGIAVRTSQFDRWTAGFLKNHANTTVLHLACGFDSRMQRVEWGDKTRWIDIDLPEVIRLRSQILPVSLPGRDYSLVGVDVLEENWMRDIVPVSGSVLVIMEGLLAYLPEKDARGLLQRICQAFPHGEIMCESVSSVALKVLNRPDSMKAASGTGALFQSSIDNPMALENLHPSLRLAESVPVIQASGTEKFPLLGRMLVYLVSWFPSGRDSAKLLRWRFGEGIGRSHENESG
ncbi:S-adenosyl-L-methionine-dependent methyltransferase [Penicillium capsulatum]|uniref:S-adenosyl-L-methionine-dependent methyltransferase n=1 Tax=Penicillium capsulatum TaxID=69766 RepID=A0A9W9LFC3_9EURO|nr:S-adenosyl-L-methionine-dependent methyltransferase [Penicillium capsulatum]KAJ6112845.1 S-adenosyl-L-methionine-dependent methyltransferase [Penicillium capsulatum]